MNESSVKYPISQRTIATENNTANIDNIIKQPHEIKKYRAWFYSRPFFVCPYQLTYTSPKIAKEATTKPTNAPIEITLYNDVSAEVNLRAVVFVPFKIGIRTLITIITPITKPTTPTTNALAI